MEKLIDEGHGTTVLIAGLIIVLSLHLIAKLAHFIWEFNNSKHEVTEDSIKNLSSALASNISAIHSLEERMRGFEKNIEEFHKFKVDLRLLIHAIKELSGDRWVEIRKIIIEDKFPM